MQTIAPYGSWKSTISAQMVAQGSLAFSEIAILNGTLYWLEGRPTEQGRITLMSWSQQNGEQELLPANYNVRSRVHEYGGGALLVTNDNIYFVNNQDQQIYCKAADGTIKKITSHSTARFADGCIHPNDQSLFYVMEDHGNQVINSIVKINPTDGTITSIASGNDFYSNPRVSPDGATLAYITWNHPNLPWDETELWTVDLKSGKHQKIAGSKEESVVDPKWAPDGALFYVSDKNNWWNIYRAQDNQCVWKIDGECALPQWIFGRSLIGFSKDTIICSYVQNAVNKYAKILPNDSIQPIDLPYTSVKWLSVEHNLMAFIGSSPDQLSSIVLYDVNAHTWQIIKAGNASVIDKHFIPQPISLDYPSAHGRIAHAFYYPPCNPRFIAPKDELPPLLVFSHGGPTGHVCPIFSLTIAYWTSRGFAVIDVNYGGSTGYGREYRDLLKKNWGIVDVDDCTNAALYSVRQGLADPNRLIIEGGSAGGFTTLAALAFKDIFKVGANYFGVTDLEIFVHDTHKFESRYLEQLVGPFPQEQQLYKDRSPVYHIQHIKSPVIIFQGDEDKIVPPSQSELIYNSLVERKIPTAYILYKGEQHGFRKAENIARSLDASLYFYAKILKFPLVDDIDPITIINFSDKAKS